MKSIFQIPALLIAFAALSAASISAQPQDLITWNHESAEFVSASNKNVWILKTVFLDNCLNQTTVSKAEYYQTFQPLGNDQFLIKTYFATGELKMTGTARQSDLPVFHGNFVYYYQSGVVESRGKYTNGIKDGIWERFDPNGDEKAERIYTGIPVEHYFETLAYKYNGK
jgi:antitoxin component YwqK of YwqJK toxin-antitoxin module